MKTRNLIALCALAALILPAHAADPKESVSDAIKALTAKGNYSWNTSSEVANSQFPALTTKGKTEKDGFTFLTVEGRNGEIQAAKKGDKAVLKTDDGWKTAEELRQEGQGQGRGRFARTRLLDAPSPATEALDLLKDAKELKAGEDGVFSSALTDEAAKDLAGFFGRRRGRGGQEGQGNNNRPEPKDAKGTVKFWVKDGVLVKFELKTSAKITFREEEREIDRTTTTAISDVGSTKVEVPEDAKKLL